MPKRKIKAVVISDVHLGSYSSNANELLLYLKSIQPEFLILNGDIIDGWAFKKNYWPDVNYKIIQRIMKLMSQGTKVHYLTGNHDEFLRKFSNFKVGRFQLSDQLTLLLDGKRYWFFHGDVFDVTMKHSKWLAKIGGKGYDYLIMLNRFVNFIMEKTGRGKISFSKRIKNNIKTAVSFISDFENTAATLAIKNNFDYVVCGHIHQPVIKNMSNENGNTTYMNSGDWVENLSVLEYQNNQWNLVFYKNLSNLDLNFNDDEIAGEENIEINEMLKEMIIETMVN